MVKRALKFATPLSIGMTIGGIYVSPKLYNRPFKPTLLATVVYFCIAFIVSFLIVLLIQWVKSKNVRN